MKHTACFFMVLTILISTVVGLSQVDLASANMFCLQYLPKVTINDDGTVTGNETGRLYRVGRTYTLTADIEGYVLSIRRDQIVLDGNGHMINSTAGDSAGVELIEVGGVTVKNLEIASRYNSIYLSGSYNCLITNVKINGRIYLTSSASNTITESIIPVLHLSGLPGANYNLITRNNITREIAVFGSNNRLFLNNFYLEDYPNICNENFWNSGSVGNYWGNYTVRYPNASQVGGAGVYDTPYEIVRTKYSTKEYPASCVDHFPLMYPYGAPGVEVFEAENATYPEGFPLVFTVNKPVKQMSYSLDGEANKTLTGNMTLNGLASGVHNLTVYAKDNSGFGGASRTVYFTVVEPFPTALVELVAGICAVSVVGVFACLFYRKRTRS